VIEDVVADAQRRMDRTIESTRQEFGSVRTGRASAGLLDRIQVSYYGTKTPLNQLAQISVPEPRLLSSV
jgi:ribosome recycling factor